MSRKVWGWRAAALASTCANPLLHKPVSNVCDWARAVWGFAIYDRVALVAIPFITLAAISLVLARSRALRLRRELVVGVLIVSTLSVAAQRWLLVANIEMVHFPQYALLAAMLLAGGLSAPAAFLGSTAAGVIDEGYQHLVVYAGRPDTYFDINDIVLNAIGAAWGVVLLGDLLSRQGKAESNVDWTGVERPRALTRGAAALLAALPLTVWLDPPQFVPMFRPLTTAHVRFRVLSTAEGLVLLTLLWAVTVVAAGRRAGRLIPRIGSRSIAVWVCVALAVWSSACASAPVRAATAPQIPMPPSASLPAPDSFVITFWCGPPFDQFTDARAEEIVAGGFNVVGPPCERPSGPFRPFEALDVAARHGLKMWVADPRYNERARTLPNWQEQIAVAVADYKDRPGFGGYFLADEPSAARFGDLSAIAVRIRELDPGAFIYVNILADYIPGGWGTATYREYVEQFVTIVRPSILSYDYYTFLEDEDRPTFFNNLEVIRDVAQEHGIPFMLIFLAMPHGPYRDPTEAELSWQALHALAYGASGISYFTYWTPVDVEFRDVMKYRHGLIENGKPTRHYNEAVRLNRVITALAKELEPFHSVSVGHSVGEVDPPLPIGPISSLEGAPVTVGLFADDVGHQAALLVNRDHRRAVIVRLRLLPGEHLPQRFNTGTSDWTESTDPSVPLPGGALLLRWPARR